MLYFNGTAKIACDQCHSEIEREIEYEDDPNRTDDPLKATVDVSLEIKKLAAEHRYIYYPNGSVTCPECQEKNKGRDTTYTFSIIDGKYSGYDFWCPECGGHSDSHIDRNTDTPPSTAPEKIKCPICNKEQTLADRQGEERDRFFKFVKNID